MRNLRIALDQLRRQPVRTFLTQVGMAIGVSTLVATLCLVEGSRRAWSVPEGRALAEVVLAPLGHPLLGQAPTLDEVEGWLAELPAPVRARVARTARRDGELRLAPVAPADAALADDVERWLLERDRRALVRWDDPDADNRAILDHIARIATLMYASGGLCLLAGAVGLFAILQTAADQRRLELAVRQVEGATQRDVLAQLACESALVCLAGTLAGIPAGFGAARIIVPLVPGSAWAVPPVELATGCGALLALGLLFGTLPAWRVAGQAPAAVLREG